MSLLAHGCLLYRCRVNWSGWRRPLLHQSAPYFKGLYDYRWIDDVNRYVNTTLLAISFARLYTAHHIFIVPNIRTFHLYWVITTAIRLLITHTSSISLTFPGLHLLRISWFNVPFFLGLAALAKCLGQETGVHTSVCWGGLHFRTCHKLKPLPPIFFWFYFRLHIRSTSESSILQISICVTL